MQKPNKTLLFLKRQEHRSKIMELRIAGHTYEQIGRILAEQESRDTPYSKQAIHKVVNKVMDELQMNCRLKIEFERNLEAERLDLLMQKPFKKATDEGSLPALDRVLKIMERRSKLLGLDTTPKNISSNPDDDIENQSRVVLYLPDNGRGPS